MTISKGELMMGPCAKQVVKCAIVFPDGDYVVGENWCANPQKECPRTVGDGYEKCKSICQQEGHAEQVALRMAGEKSKGANAFLVGHTHACKDCQEAMFAAGVKSFSVISAVSSPHPTMPQPETNLPISGLGGYDQVLRDEFEDGKK
jgi:deoxycytidylate deaminase